MHNQKTYIDSTRFDILCKLQPLLLSSFLLTLEGKGNNASNIIITSVNLEEILLEYKLHQQYRLLGFIFFGITNRKMNLE